jgi:hypothetical protein
VEIIGKSIPLYASKKKGAHKIGALNPLNYAKPGTQVYNPFPS